MHIIVFITITETDEPTRQSPLNPHFVPPELNQVKINYIVKLYTVLTEHTHMYIISACHLNKPIENNIVISYKRTCSNVLIITSYI